MSITSGVFNRVGGDDRCQQESATPPHEVNSANMDAEFNDFAGAINQTFFRDGSAVATGNWDMGGFNLSNIGTINGNISFGVGSAVSFFGDNTFVLGTTRFNDGFISNGLADFSSGQVDIKTRMSFKDFGYMQFNNNPTHDGACAFGGEIDFKGGAIMKNHTPFSGVEAGTPWKITVDENYIYVWTGPNNVKRVALSSFF